MKVSVIIPSFNRRQLTRRAVHSVLEQSYPDLEVLVVDDCSREAERFEPEASGQSRVRVLRHDTNRGVAAARNTGVQAAAGALIAFLDSDDYWLPGKLARHVEQFTRIGRPDGSLLYSAYLSADGPAHARTPVSGIRRGQRVSDYLFVDCGCMHVNTWLAHKSLFERVPFDTTLKQSEDWDALLRMEAIGTRFFYDDSPAAVRNIDLRQDRLTTFTDIATQWRFLAMNSDRMTPQARAVLRGLLTEQERPSRSKLAWALNRFQLLLSADDLSWLGRLKLLAAYTHARLRRKQTVLLTGGPPELVTAAVQHP